MLESAEENVQNLSSAKHKPHAMDNYTIGRVFEVYGTQKKDLWLYNEQLARWQKQRLTKAQSEEVNRLQGQMVKLEKSIDENLELAEFFKDKTIETIMNKDDVELAMEFLMGKRTI